MIDEQTGEIMLSDPERAELVELEAVIQRGIQQFVAVGNALMQIRDRGLYRADYTTFDEYCRGRWNIGRGHAYRLMDAARVVTVLSPIGDTVPVNEAQARELAGLDDDAVKVAWTIVKETAPDGKVTSGHIKSVVEVMRQAVVTGAIDDGDGGSIRVHDLVGAAINEETAERIKRQIEYIKAAQADRVTWRTTVVVTDDGLVQWNDAPPPGKWAVVLRGEQS